MKPIIQLQQQKQQLPQVSETKAKPTPGKPTKTKQDKVNTKVNDNKLTPPKPDEVKAKNCHVGRTAAG